MSRHSSSLRVFGLALALCVLVSACATNPARLPLVTPDPSLGQTEPLLIATTRARDETGNRPFSDARSMDLEFADAGIWVPREREPGHIDYPGTDAHPASEFALSSYEALGGEAEFVERLNARLAVLPDEERQVVVFVHGFNTPFSNGLYFNAQIVTEFQIEGAGVHFAWPSAGRLSAYLYDRESVQFSRDGLVHTLELLSRSDAESITVIAHSMGALLTMESLRQLSLTGRTGVIERLNAVILASPDIDSDVFREQVASMEVLPEHLVVFVSHRDRLLALSSFVRGERAARVVSGNHVDELTRMGVAVIDLTRFSDAGSFNHTTFASSPVLMSMVTSGALQAALLGEQDSDTAGPAGRLAALASSIISLPVRALGGK